LKYAHADRATDRRLLEPFAWQLTRNATINQVGGWLASGRFPELQNSYQILGRLSLDQIGTDDEEIIARHIAPPLRPSLEIKIRWREGSDPGDSVYIEQEYTAHQQQHVAVRDWREPDLLVQPA